MFRGYDGNLTSLQSIMTEFLYQVSLRYGRSEIPSFFREQPTVVVLRRHRIRSTTLKEGTSNGLKWEGGPLSLESHAAPAHNLGMKKERSETSTIIYTIKEINLEDYR